MLKDKLLEDYKSAIKYKDWIKRAIIQTIRSEIIYTERQAKRIANNADVIDIIRKELKKRKEALPDYERSKNEYSLYEIKREMELLKEYLPVNMPEDELAVLVETTITELHATTVKDASKVMISLMNKTKGYADAKMMSKMVKQRLASLSE